MRNGLLDGSGPSNGRIAPPTVDLAARGREVLRAAIPALLIAIVVAAVVLALRTASATKQDEATVVAPIDVVEGVMMPNGRLDGSGPSDVRIAPPTVDLVAHGREVLRAAIPALLIAIVVAAVVFGLRTASATKQYEATVVAQIDVVNPAIPGDAYTEQFRAPYDALVRDNNVLTSVLGQVDTGWDAQTLAAHTELSPGVSPTIFDIVVQASSPEVADTLARTMVVALDQAAATQQARQIRQQSDEIQATIATLQQERDALPQGDTNRAVIDAELNAMQSEVAKLDLGGTNRLSILSEPDASATQVSPRPAAEAAVAGVVSFLVAAELIVFLRGRAGSRTSKAWGRRIARKYHGGFAIAGPSTNTGLPAQTELRLNHLASGGGDILVLTGNGVEVDPSQALPPSPGSGVRTLALEGRWWQQIRLADVIAALVVVTDHSKDRHQAEVAVRELSELTIPTEVVVQTGRRAPVVVSAAEPVRAAAEN